MVDMVVEELFDVFSAMDVLDGLPEARYVVDQMIPEGSVTLLVGEAGCGKTYAMLSLCLCVSTGMDWTGKQTQQGTALFVDEESGQNRLLRRVQSIMNGYGINPFDAWNCKFVSGEGFNLTDERGVNRFERLIEGQCPSLVVIDALADVIPGVDENSVKDVQPAFMALRRIAEEHNVAIVVIHHTNKSGGYRGSSAMKGSVDLLLTVESNSRQSTLTFKSEKVRDGEPFEFSALTRFGDASFYLAEVTGKRLVSDSISKSAVLRAFQDLGTLTTDEAINTSKIFAPSISKESVRRIIRQLVDDGYLKRVDQGGQGKKATYGLVS